MAAKKKAGAKKKAAAKKKAPAKTPKRAAAKKTARAKAERVTLASLAAQMAELASKVDAIHSLLEGQRNVAAVVASPEPAPPLDFASFEADLLSTLADLDRRGRHAGLVPVPEVRVAFLDRGWTRDVFDECLLQAERDFVVDLKTADDPATLANPDLAIHEAGRGHLQYVVTR